MLEVTKGGDPLPGARVVYTTAGRAPEFGVFVGVNTAGAVMVRYDGDKIAKATSAASLKLVHELGRPMKVHREDEQTRCGNGNCSRRHDYIIECSCKRKFWTGKLKYTRRRAQNHLEGREESWGL